MNRKIGPTVVILGFFILFVGARVMKNNNDYSRFQDQVIEYPDQVKAIIDNKCYGCHSIQGKLQDARDALIWDSLPSLSKARQVAALDVIIEVLDEGTMPPQKRIEADPDAKLTEAEHNTLRNWAETTADDLLK